MPFNTRRYFMLRRLHSLTGVLPVGVFLAEHFFTNSFAVQGEQAFNEKVDFLRSIPYLYLVEIGGIFLPILFHALLGFLIYREAKLNPGRLKYKQNWLFTLQRLTGLFLIFFIGYHVLTTRFGSLFGSEQANLFKLMTEKLNNPWILAVYALGVIAASLHLGNGLWGFAIHWGLLTGRENQRRWSWAGLAVGLAFALAGLNSLLAFEPLGLKPVKIFNSSESTHSAAPAATPTEANH